MDVPFMLGHALEIFVIDLGKKPLCQGDKSHI